jgi:hypothetical protein
MKIQQVIIKILLVVTNTQLVVIRSQQVAAFALVAIGHIMVIE